MFLLSFTCNREVSVRRNFLFLFGANDRLSYFNYANMPMQYTMIFHGCKNYNFQIKNCDIFLIFAPNIDCGYTLELPH